ncbi:hypothetical protein LEP1GSC088_2565 [Leptospira interrogans str. L1207]|nr:hypothetical protein LEP1GSC088_2565 [Leptospira interrogans str. L1207]
MLEKLPSQPSLWQLTGPKGFSKHFYNVRCEDVKEEQKLYQLLHSIGANPGKGDWIDYSPLCSEIPDESESKDPKTRERSLRRISILLKMGAPVPIVMFTRNIAGATVQPHWTLRENMD